MSEAPAVGEQGFAGQGMRLVSGVVARPLDQASLAARVQDPRAGAIAVFVGQVRDHDPSVTGEVVALEYSAHPDADRVLAAIVARFAGPEVLGVAVEHRIGRLGVGDAAIVAAVATAHRALAFEVCRAMVEAVKAELPVWKREVLRDGSHHWVGMEDLDGS
jgi:molybdopterin synthase catalytic subunit